MATDIGRMRELIVVQYSTPTTASGGQGIKTWATLPALPDGCSARAEFISVQESEEMNTITARVSVKFTIRYEETVTEYMRIVWRDHYWNILGVIPFERLDYMELTADRAD